MENTVPHPAPRQRTLRHRLALALTPGRRGRDAGAGCGGDVAGRGRPTDRRGRTEARGQVGGDHARTAPAACAIARNRDPRDGLVSV